MLRLEREKWSMGKKKISTPSPRPPLSHSREGRVYGHTTTHDLYME